MMGNKDDGSVAYHSELLFFLVVALISFVRVILGKRIAVFAMSWNRKKQCKNTEKGLIYQVRAKF